MTSRLTIDLDALAHNHAELRNAAAGAEVAPVIKADGYGLGVGPVARRLWVEGARTFFVARLEEGERLRAELADRTADILILDGLGPDAVDRMASARLTPALSAVDQVQRWGARPAVLHVDTGMNRLGLTLDEAAGLAASGYSPSLVMSHLGSAAEADDPRNAEQLGRFRQARALFPNARASLSASAGIYLGDDYRFDVVRPGISLFGGGPREIPDAHFRAVATLTAPILQIRDLRAGERVGYGAAYTAHGDRRIALVECGYADGVIRAGRGRAKAWLEGRPAPIVIVTMDLIAIDVTDVPEARPGAIVELLGEQAKLDDLAAAVGSVAHECLVRLGSRGERTYVGQAD